MTTAPAMSAQAQVHEEERILAGLVHHGPLTFRTIRRKVLPNADYNLVGNAIRRLQSARQAETYRLRGGPALWRITDAGRARLKLPPLQSLDAAPRPTAGTVVNTFTPEDSR